MSAKDLGYRRSLEEKVEHLERNAKSSSLEIGNVPKITVETREDLINIVKAIGVAVKNEIHIRAKRCVSFEQ